MKVINNTNGTLPTSSVREATVGEVPDTTSMPVKISQGKYVLTYVESIDQIDSGPVSAQEIVDSWTLDNGNIKVTVVLKGGNLVSIKYKDQEYIWQNIEGATYYGANSDAFPLTRGLILHGGIRVAAGTAEHGLYYDTDWDISFAADTTGSSIILSIQDTQENRDLLVDPLSKGQFSSPGSDVPMSKYPVTDAEYTFTITLKPGEDYVHIKAGLKNTKNEPVSAEIWVPQTYPINRDSQVISEQKKRRCRDIWVYQEMLKDNYLAKDMRLESEEDLQAYKGKDAGFVIGIPPSAIDYTNPNLDKPLDWPSAGGGILYDYPYRDGTYHAVSFGDGRGAAYVSTSTKEEPHYTKMWSWGNPDLFNRQEALQQDPPLAAGRPKAEYYEPWASAFNTGFFEPSTFIPGEHSWDALIVPIDSGLENHKSRDELQTYVKDKVDNLI